MSNSRARTSSWSQMETQSTKAWVFTGGYPASLKPGIIHPPRSNGISETGTQFLVQIKACALNPVDIQLMNSAVSSLPSILSGNGSGAEKGTVCDFAGKVIAGGGSGFKAGDEVLGMTLASNAPNQGALAEIACFDTKSTVAVKKPKDWSWSQAAAISLVWLTARTSVERVAEYVEGSASKKVAVLGGSSATGMYSVMIAKQRGWNVVATSSGRNKEFVLGTLGADSHVDYTSQDVRQAVGEFEPVAVIDCVGGTECIGLPSSKRYISIVGDKTSRSSMGGPYTYYNFLSYHAPLQWLRWAKGYLGLGESYDVIILDLKKEYLEEATRMLKPEQIFIDSTFAFDDAKAAFERLNTGRAKGKVVVEVSK